MLNPWMPEPFRMSVTETLRTIQGCENLRVKQSRLINSEAWKRYAVKARQREEKMNEAPAWMMEENAFEGIRTFEPRISSHIWRVDRNHRNRRDVGVRRHRRSDSFKASDTLDGLSWPSEF